MGATLLDGAYCSGTKLGLMGGLDEVIEFGMRLGMEASIGAICSIEVYAVMWAIV